MGKTIQHWVAGYGFRRIYTSPAGAEARNALAKAVLFNHLCEVRDRSFEQQRYRTESCDSRHCAVEHGVREAMTQKVQLSCALHAIRPPSPPTSGHLFHAHPARQSERSAATQVCIVSLKSLPTSISLHACDQAPVWLYESPVSRAG
ncbi:transposase [Pseudomonas syringae pv. actinidiae ICMP 18807]|uniref:Transposase n=1 Tax=Pseudomonas syringae pv. actinidiae ICMP 18807 TaxID=1194404 RepID=S6ULZ2_PSESF|nr:transposase [Pseudomonas syringae pv. actinidiae ICMP 18807]